MTTLNIKNYALSIIFNQLSADMRSMFPNETGFSVTNLKYMKRWYLFYNDQVAIRQQAADEIGHQAGDEIQKQVLTIRQQAADEIGHQAGDEIQKQVLTIRHQAGDELGMPTIFGRVPWKHHVEIFTKSQSLEEVMKVHANVPHGWQTMMLMLEGMLPYLSMD